MSARCRLCGCPVDADCTCRRSWPFVVLALALLLAAIAGTGCASCPPCPPPPPPDVVKVAIRVPVVPPELANHTLPAPAAILTNPEAALADPAGWIRAAAAYIDVVRRVNEANAQEIAASNAARAEAEAEAKRIREELARQGITLPPE